MTILDFFKTAHPSVLAAKMIFRHLQEHHPVQKISDIADTTSGGTPNRGMIEYYNGNIPWVKSGELKDGLITNCDEYITEAGLKNSSAKLFPKGTLLVAMYGANIGKTGVLDFAATTNQAVCAIFPKVDISKEFLFWYFKQERIDFIAIGKGGAQPNISQTVINNASIVVPDEATQNKIVTFLERIEKGGGIDRNFYIPEVLNDIERIYKYKNSYVDLTESFETQLSQIDNLNQAILQEAVQGKLVKQEKKDEPANELLKRIKEEKAKSGKKEKPLSPIKPEEIPFEIPKSWIWCRLGEVVSHIFDGPFGSHLKTKDYTASGIQVIRLQNLGVMRFKDEKETFINNEKYKTISQHTVYEGDVLIGSFLADGVNCVVFPKLKHTSIAKADCFTIRISHQLLSNHFVMYLLSSKPMFDELSKLLRGMTRLRINTTQLKQLPIPLPPLSEQKRIVAEIEKELAKTEQLKKHIIANQQATEQLLKALLHQAFEVNELEEVEN
jgi:type I restriction enzyme S subunit